MGEAIGHGRENKWCRQYLAATNVCFRFTFWKQYMMKTNACLSEIDQINYE